MSDDSRRLPMAALLLHASEVCVDYDLFHRVKVGDRIQITG